ncbi:zinc finger protein 90-like [Wyeomyia smithii]|uniref:zinc finger protein 90-like n=1 Tax=Wyeomyia smithii TaxID=174621 RepID=UPI0024680643|nr:zinc finger protein 90-like [Wyeomyia smithii]
MTIFNLKNFPNVCRLCLQAKSSAELITLDSYQLLHRGTIVEMLEEMSFTIPADLACYLPMEICEQCLEVFELFYKYKRKLVLTQHFITSLAEVKAGNQAPLRALFDTERDQLNVLFKDLNLCDNEDVQADDLIGEFDEYEIASTLCVKVETGEEEDLKPNFHSEFKKDSSDEASEDIYDIQDFTDEFQKSLEEHQEPTEKITSEFTFPDERSYMEDAEEDQKSQYTLIENEFDDDFECEPDIAGTSFEPNPRKRRRLPRLQEEEVEPQDCILNCNYSTTYPSQFEKHLAKVHGTEEGTALLTCYRKSCNGELVDSIELLRQHKNDAHFTHICLLCGKVLKHLIALENHLKYHDREREPLLQCELCDELFRTQAEVIKHAAKVHSARLSFDCPECGLSFKQKLLLTQHMLTHSVERNYNCEQCDMSFKTSNHLRRHIRTVHTEVRYTCEHCQMSYGRRDKLRMHMERVHDIQTYFVCDICCSSFETNDKLQEHKYRHEHPIDLNCGVCLIACATADEFNEHLCITYQDDYVCCNRDFRYHSYYNRHMFLTHGINVNARVKPRTGVLMGKQRALRKPVERCTKCEQVFSTRKLKKQHMDVCQGQVVIFEIEPVADETNEG